MMKVIKNEKGEIVSVQEVQLPTSSQNIKAEIEGLSKLVEQFKTKISELQSTLKEVEKLEKQK
jgi:prefoldin subunit 5